MERSEIIRSVENAVEALSQPLSQEERAYGWNDARRTDILKYFENLERDLKDGKPIPFFSLVRALDGMGISEGVLFEKLCRVNNAVNRLQ